MLIEAHRAVMSVENTGFLNSESRRDDILYEINASPTGFRNHHGPMILPKCQPYGLLELANPGICIITYERQFMLRERDSQQ